MFSVIIWTYQNEAWWFLIKKMQEEELDWIPSCLPERQIENSTLLFFPPSIWTSTKYCSRIFHSGIQCDWFALEPMRFGIVVG